MAKFSVREVVEQAVQTEKIGNEFYSSVAGKFRENHELKELFEVLASQELKHEKIFTELEKQIRDGEPEGWDEVSLYLKALVDSEFFLGKDKSLSAIKSVNTAAEAIRYALGFERETLLYYHGLRETIKEKGIIDGIIEEEKKHIVWLNNLKKSFI